MTRIVWAPQALYKAVRTYLPAIPLSTPISWSSEFAAVSRPEHHPRSGRMVSEVGEPSLREVVIRNDRVIYRLRRDAVEILTVFHGARSFPPG